MRRDRVLELDLVVQRGELVGRHPLFADLDATSLRQLARHLKTRYVEEHTTIIDKDRVERRMHFIVSGAVEVEHAGRTIRLGLGETFGAETFLPGAHRRIRVRTLVPSTLLVLDESRFRRLLEHSPGL